MNVPVFSRRSSAERFERWMGAAPVVLVPETLADLLAGPDAVPRCGSRPAMAHGPGRAESVEAALGISAVPPSVPPGST